MAATLMLKKLITIVFLLMVMTAEAETSIHAFSNEADQARYKHLTLELRCPKCQNQDLADSNAPIATDLRNQIIQMIEQGKSDQEIINYMVERYGEFVLYRPRFAGYNVILWIMPLLLVCLGLGVIAFIVRMNRQDPQALPLDDKEKQLKLEQLLAQRNES